MDKIKFFYTQLTRWVFPILLIVCVYSLFTCNGFRDKSEQLNATLATNEERTKQIENDRGQMVAMNKTLIAQSSNDLKSFTDTFFNLKREQSKLIAQVTGYTKLLQNISFLGKEAVYVDRPGTNTKETVYLPQPDDTSLIRVPRQFTIADSTIILSGTVKRSGVGIDSLIIPNTVHIRTVTEKTGFLKLGRVETVQVINTNPDITSQVS